MLITYRQHTADRAAEGVPPLPLTAEQVALLVDLLKNPPAGEADFLIHLLVDCVPPGVDQAAYVKAAFLADVAHGKVVCPLISQVRATEILGTMIGGYNVVPLIALLDNEATAEAACAALSKTLLIYDAYHDVTEKAKTNTWAQKVVQAWADAQWFTDKPALAESITVTVFKVSGETNTDDLSPATEAWSRPDIPVHAKAMLRDRFPNLPELVTELKAKGHPVAYVGDVVGKGSSRK
jgi:aconitate hydratase 2/2-methylisocitrate dehydratase